MNLPWYLWALVALFASLTMYDSTVMVARAWRGISPWGAIASLVLWIVPLALLLQHGAQP